MTTKIKGFAQAHTHHGGYEKWLYDEIKALREAVGTDSELEERVTALETLIGDEDTPDSILGRIKALET